MLALVKQNLRNKYHTEVTVMTAFRKQIANLSGIRLVQEVVENEETRQATCRLAKFGWIFFPSAANSCVWTADFSL
jgi:hypothetical protein